MHVIIMCKAPVPGCVKTRLTPHYSSAEAAAIHQAMAATVIRRAATIFSNVSIACDDMEHPFFKHFPLNKIPQGGGNLGVRLIRLMKQAFTDGNQSVLFLGTDSPHMSASRLYKAVELLSQFDAVVGPVEDGGYDLITMKHPFPELFRKIPWGSQHVLKETMQIAEASGIRMGLLDMDFDLDRVEDLERAAPVWRPSICPAEKQREN